jgi:hypothetical protein
MDRSVAHAAGKCRAAPPSHPLEDYVGDYEHPGYGVYSVRAQDGRMQLVMNGKHTVPLEHYHYDIFQAIFEQWDWRPKLAFATDTHGNIAGFSAQPESMAREVLFARRPPAALANPARLAAFCGEYELRALPMLVALRDGKLFATLPGQEYELVPYEGTEFTLRGLAGFSIEFKPDEAGVYTEALVTEPDLVLVARRKAGQ